MEAFFVKTPSIFLLPVASVVSASLLLLVVAGGAFSGFQSWVQLQTRVDARVESLNPLWTGQVSGIRAMITSDSSTAVEPAAHSLQDTTKSLATPFSADEEGEALAMSAMPAIPSSATTRAVSFPSSPMSSATEAAPGLLNAETALHNPQLIQFDEELIVEFPPQVTDLMQIKRALARVMLSERPFEENLLSQARLEYRKPAYFYRQIINQQGQAIRYPASAFEYADYLLNSPRTERVADEDGTFLVISIPLVKPAYPRPVEKYRDWVSQYSQAFKVEPALVFAVMETESNFKPDAVSRSNALGLMQVKAEAAGRDIYRYIDQKPGAPKPEELFDERNNIRMGAAYLGLLKHEYLSEVRNLENKEMLSIASYNGGLSTVLKLFGETPDKAIARINQLHPKQVYRKLRFEHASKETRDYLDKVLKAKSRYQQLLSA